MSIANLDSLRLALAYLQEDIERAVTRFNRAAALTITDTTTTTTTTSVRVAKLAPSGRTVDIKWENGVDIRTDLPPVPDYITKAAPRRGPKSRLTPEDWEQVIRRVSAGEAVSKVALHYGVTAECIYQHLRVLRAQAMRAPKGGAK